MAAGKVPEGKAQKKAQKPRKRSFLWRLLSVILFLGLVATAAVSVGVAWYVNKISADLPSDEEILSYEANEASIVYDRKNRVITSLYIENRQPVKLEEVSRWMVMSILAAEDSAFYSHMGIRPMAILRSLLSGERGQGASTITQQLARNLFLTREKSLERKAKEALISLRMELLYSKDKLLETYLNAIYFGHGAWGIDAAAHRYFAKSASDLTLAESSILAGLVAAPEKYSPIRHLDRAKVRQNYVLGRMVRLGWATEEEAKAAAEEQLTFNSQAGGNSQSFKKAPYFVSHVLFKELIPRYGSDRVYKGGMKIYTTLDLDLQQAAEEAMKGLKSEGALVAIDPDSGAVLALVGGKDYAKTKFNRATQAFRQTGSVFKPAVYVTALEAGYRPVDHILDKLLTLYVPFSVEPTWTPHNFSNEYAGEETLLNALAHSHNTPVVRLTCMLGPQKIVNTARRLGITSQHLEATLSVGLGVASVTPLEMSVMYSVFANGGARVEPYFTREIRSKEGQILFSALPSQAEALRPETALMARSMLAEVIRAGTGSRAKMSGYEMFGKTGTSNDFTDAWFAGGVPGLVTVVYAGNDDLKPLGGKGATGGRIALPIWSTFMKRAVVIMNTPSTFPEVGADLSPMRVCVKSGYPPASGCKSVTTILLPENRIPDGTCPLHGGEAAPDDENAPRLLLLPQDKKDVVTEEIEEDTSTTPEIPVPTDEAPTTEIAPPPAPETSESKKTGSWRDGIKKDNRPVEERYQELLRKYHIK